MNELLVKSQVTLLAHIALQGDTNLQRLTEIYTEILFTRLVNSKVGKLEKNELKEVIRQYRNSRKEIDIERICLNLNKNSSIQHRLILLINLLEFGLFAQKNAILLSHSNNLSGLIKSISGYLRIPAEAYGLCTNFVSGKLYDTVDRSNILIVSSYNPNLSGFHFIEQSNLKGYFIFVYFPQAESIFFKYHGQETIQLNSKPIQPKSVYLFQSGSTLTLNGRPLLYYSQIIGQFKGLSEYESITLKLKNIQFRYSKSNFGLHNISLTATSGEIIGVMGGSGVGKSTLFNLLNGSFTPKQGTISLNGVRYSENLPNIQKLIGYVPQDDSLFENLTVFENLYYIARLALGNFTPEQTAELVNARLAEFGLYQIRNHRVGSSISRNISGGQRKRLNIVSEIIREPKLLLVDEPTSGLSSADSLRVMSLLREQALSGRLVVVNIHQPSAEIYRLFDKILILDQGGYMVYFGNPLEALRHFKLLAGHIDADEVECSTCHNIKSDEIFDIIEEKQVDEYGQLTEVRKVSPIEWNSRFIPAPEIENLQLPLPKVKSEKASPIRQLNIFIKRLTLTKLRDVEFFIFAFVIPALLALVIAAFSKYSISNETGGYTYIFYENYNIPIFFLTSIIACLFLGMIITSDSIIKDANVNKREAFLFLSQKAYYNSKVMFYFSLTAIQTLIYTAISIYILQVRGMFLQTWIIMLFMGFLGNVVGLIVSTIFRSLSAAYLIVPFLVIPQIIFSGITIPFNRMNYHLSNPEYVPVIGMVSPSMWGMEALLVYQFMSNDYEKHYFMVDMVESQCRINSQYLIPKIFQLIHNLNSSSDKKEQLRYKELIAHGVSQLNLNLNSDSLSNPVCLKKLELQLNAIQLDLQKRYSKALREKDLISSQLIDSLGGYHNLLKLKQQHTNKGVEDLTLSRKNIVAFQVSENRVIQSIDPIFKIPANRWGRAHFLAPYKQIGNWRFNTFHFNVVVLGFILIIAYLLFIFNALPKLFARLTR